MWFENGSGYSSRMRAAPSVRLVGVGGRHLVLGHHGAAVAGAGVLDVEEAARRVVGREHEAEQSLLAVVVGEVGDIEEHGPPHAVADQDLAFLTHDEQAP